MGNTTDSHRALSASDLFGVAVRAAFEPGNGDTDGEQMWNGQWWRPKWGCDTLALLLEAMGELHPLNDQAHTQKGRERGPKNTQD